MRLAKLPPPIEAPRQSLHSLCVSFERDLKDWITGEGDKKDFVINIEKSDKQFLKEVKFSIATFGLADFDEEAAGTVKKVANDFLFENKGNYSRPPTSLMSVAAMMPHPATPPPRNHAESESDGDLDVIEITPSPASKRGHFPPHRPRPKKSPQSSQVQPDLAPRTPPEEVTVSPTSNEYTGNLIIPARLTESREVYFTP